MHKKLKPINIGYVLQAQRARLAFSAPTLVGKSRSEPLSNRAVQACPAVNTYEYRLYEIKSPFDIGLRCTGLNENGGIHVVPSLTRLDEELIQNFVIPMPKRFWRTKNHPVVQIAIPYYFVCDEVCYLNQLPPYLSESFLNFPGLFISGRFPTHLWPRSLNLAFEWHDIDKDMIIKRGDPITYLFFETEKPAAPINLIEAKETLALVNYRKNIEDLPKFTSQSFTFMRDLELKRPKKLLYPA